MSTRKKTDSQELQALLSRRYPVTFYPAEEGGYVAEIEDLPGCMTQGETIDEAAAAIEGCRGAWIETALADGMDVPPPRTEADYSGRFLLRLPKSLHRRLAARARQDGVSLNTELATLLASALEVKEQQSRTKAIVRAILDARVQTPAIAQAEPRSTN
jgi:predicted RNase H-like HicB family nuclease